MVPISEGKTLTHTCAYTLTLTILNDICLRSGTARRKQRLCARADLKRAHRQTHATASVLSGRAQINSRRHGNRAAQQKAASSRGWEGCCYGFNELELGGKKRLIFYFFLLGMEPNEENKRRTSVAAGSGSSNPHTSAANAGGDGRMCATCEEFVVFTRCSALIAPRAHFSCSAAAFVAAEVS